MKTLLYILQVIMAVASAIFFAAFWYAFVSWDFFYPPYLIGCGFFFIASVILKKMER